MFRNITSTLPDAKALETKVPIENIEIIQYIKKGVNINLNQEFTQWQIEKCLKLKIFPR